MLYFNSLKRYLKDIKLKYADSVDLIKKLWLICYNNYQLFMSTKSVRLFCLLFFVFVFVFFLFDEKTSGLGNNIGSYKLKDWLRNVQCYLWKYMVNTICFISIQCTTPQFGDLLFPYAIIILNCQQWFFEAVNRMFYILLQLYVNMYLGMRILFYKENTTRQYISLCIID